MTRAHIRSRLQLEQSARRLLQNAFAQGCDDDAAIDFAVSAMGQEHKALVVRVLARDFTAYGGAG
jgi:hypothetical protein